MEYPEEIYAAKNGGLMADSQLLVGMVGWGRRHAYQVGYEAGKAGQADPLAGYSNLTAAISAKEPIDWERLDGLVTKCVHPTLGSLLYPLEVDGNGRKVIWNNEGNFWFTTNGGKAWAEALREAWFGDNGWTLYVEGDIPLRRKTADQLPVGMCFEGDYHGSRIELAQVIANRYGKRLVTDHEEKNIGGYAEEEVEVVKEYGIGTFQKPEWK